MSDVVVNFQPADALLGGAFLGVATVGKLLLTGRILGISGSFKVRLLESFADHGFTEAALATKATSPNILRALSCLLCFTRNFLPTAHPPSLKRMPCHISHLPVEQRTQKMHFQPFLRLLLFLPGHRR